VDLSKEAKRTALENAISNTANEIYSLCLHVGVDPDGIDPEDTGSFVPNDVTEADPNFYTFQRISRACASHVLAKQKLAQLNSQG
jgi:hypothetical protein